LGLALFFCVIIVGVGIWYFSPLYQAVHTAQGLKTQLNEVKHYIGSGEYMQAEEKMVNLSNTLGSLNDSLQEYGWIENMPWVGYQLYAARVLLEEAGLISNDGVEAIRAADPLLALAETTNSDAALNIEGEQEIGPYVLSTIEDVKPIMLDVRDTVALSEARLAAIDRERLIGPLAESYTMVDEYLPQLQQTIDEGLPLMDVVPEALGGLSPKHYLLVFSNNVELRPGGGFIGNYGIFTVDRGTINLTQVNDVYKIDNDEIASHFRVQPPAILKQQLKVNYLGFRDANWSPDFPTNAQELMRFYQMEVGEQVDGVISIDPIVVEDLLRLFGEITVPDYNITVNADNVTYEIEYEVQKGFSDFETRKGFVGEIAKIVFQKSMTARGDQLNQLVAILKKNLEEKHLQLYIPNDTITDFLANHNWYNAVATVPQDYLMINDANLGGNKVNFYVDESITYVVNKKADGTMEGEAHITYNNPSNWGWPGGAYQTYLRVYVPYGSQLIQQEGYTSNFSVFNEFEGTPSQKTVFAGMVKTTVKSSREVVVRYTLPFQIQDKQFDYALTVQKQAGTPTIPARSDVRGYPLIVSLRTEDSCQLTGTIADQAANGQNNQIDLSSDLRVDRTLSIAGTCQ
jgi:hypothetical protein